MNVINRVEYNKDTGEICLLIYSPEKSYRVPMGNLPMLFTTYPMPVKGSGVTITSVLKELKRMKKKGKLEGFKIKNPEWRGGKLINRVELYNSERGYNATDIMRAWIPETIGLKGSKRRVIQLEGPSTRKNELNKLKVFRVGSYSRPDSIYNVADMHRMQVGWPFGKIEQTDNGILFLHETPTLDWICSQPITALDSEFEGWEKRGDYDFTDLPVSLEAVQKYLHKASKKVSEMTDDEIRKEYESDFRKKIQGLSKEEAINALKEYKFELTPKQPFNIPLSTDKEGLPDFCFVRDQLDIGQLEITTQFETKKFEIITCPQVTDLDSRIERLVGIFGEEKREHIQQLYLMKRDQVETPEQGIVLLSAITNGVINGFATLGYNLPYDHTELRGKEGKEGEEKCIPTPESFFICGVDGKVPIIDAQMGFSVRTVDGKPSIDGLSFMRKYMKGTINDKLVTASLHLLGIEDAKCGIGGGGAYTYLDTTINNIAHQLGNIDAGKLNVKYACQDSLLHKYVGYTIMRDMYRASLFLGVTPEILGASAKRISKMNFNRTYFKRTGHFPYFRFGDKFPQRVADMQGIEIRSANGGKLKLHQRIYGKADLDEAKIQHYTSLIKTEEGIDEDKKEILKTRHGCYPDADIFYLTDMHAFRKFIEANAGAQDIIKRMGGLQQVITTQGDLAISNKQKIVYADKLEPKNRVRVARNIKLFLAQVLDNDWMGFFRHLVRESTPTRAMYNDELLQGKVPVPEKDAYKFWKTTGVKLSDLEKEMYAAKEKFQTELKAHGGHVVNTGVLTALWLPPSQRAGFIQMMEREMIAYHYAPAKVVSTGTKGRYMMYVDGEVMSQGMDAKFTKGMKCEYMGDTITGFFKRIFEDDKKDALEFLIGSISELENGEIDMDKMVFKWDVKNNLNEYSDRYQKTRRWHYMKLAGVKKGDKFGFAYVQDGTWPSWNVEFIPQVSFGEYDAECYKAMLFGQMGVKNWRFGSYDYWHPRGEMNKATTIAGDAIMTALAFDATDNDLQKEKKKAVGKILSGDTDSVYKSVLTSNELMF